MSIISAEAQKVREALIAKGIETPTVQLTKDKDSRRAEIQQHHAFGTGITGIGFTRR
ncbi:GTP cyclohydrolase I [Actinobacillus pleuropneumoniae]|nr:GTP cyclohydrolase I [Actinobacillus pleuropneumoniae]